jgi:hypothetical protein
VSGIDKNRRDKRGYANPDYKTRHEHGYVTLCRMRLAIPDEQSKCLAERDRTRVVLFSGFVTKRKRSFENENLVDSFAVLYSFRASVDSSGEF